MAFEVGFGTKHVEASPASAAHKPLAQRIIVLGACPPHLIMKTVPPLTAVMVAVSETV